MPMTEHHSSALALWVIIIVGRYLIRMSSTKIPRTAAVARPLFSLAAAQRCQVLMLTLLSVPYLNSSRVFTCISPSDAISDSLFTLLEAKWHQGKMRLCMQQRTKVSLFSFYSCNFHSSLTQVELLLSLMQVELLLSHSPLHL